MSDDLVAHAPALRVAWFSTVAPELERTLPGAWQALSMAAVELTDEGQLSVRIPTVYPVFKPVHAQVRTAVSEVLQAVPGLDVACIVKFSAREPRPVRKHPTGLDVYHWGDPQPDDWSLLASGLIEAHWSLG